MADALPYAAEYAKSGRASCKGCKTPIPQASLRLAVMVQSAFHDAKQPNWFHNDCFFKKQRPQSVGDFGNFENLRYEDQKAIREKIENSAGAVLPTKGTGKKRSKEESAALKDFGVEYAKSSRAACRGCELKIGKDEIRIKKVVFDTEVGMKYGGQPLWHHLDCFALVRNDLGWFECGDKLPGFNSLKKEDKDKVKKSIPAIKAEDIPEPKKAKLEPKDEKDLEEEKKLEELIEKQTKEFFIYRDNLDQKMKKDILSLLEANHQIPPAEDNSKLFDLAADILAFGALKACEECAGGQFVFNKSGYICTGDLTEWTKCTKFVKEPKRVACKIPSDLKEKYSFLKKYKCKVQNRAVRYVAPSAQALAMTGKLKKEDQLDGPRVKKDKPALYMCHVAVALKDSKEEEAVNKRLIALGAKIIKTVQSNTLMVITNQAFFEKHQLNSKIKRAKWNGVHVVPVEYLDAVEKDPAGAISYITSTSICDWGNDPTGRLPAEEDKSAKSKSIYTKSVPKSQNLQLKGGLAVDPDSGLVRSAHVYVKGDIKYSAVLGLTDVQANKNKYYKLQLLESDNSSRYFLFRSWGRIGTSIGGVKKEDCSSLNEAIKLFEQHYFEKSGNPFSAHTNNFVKRPGLMYPIDIDYGEDKTVDLKVEHKVKSKLPTPVQDLMKLLFDIDAMKRVMQDFHLDMEKMPLGKLSKKQLHSAYKVLTEISELVEKGGSNAKFIDATNRFYTLIPQSFGVDTPPILDTTEQVKNLSDMLDSLMEIECAYSMMKEEKEEVEEVDDDVNPIDRHYEQLKTKLVPMDKTSEEFKTLVKYVQNTHAETHRMYELEVVEVFKVERSGESRRFKPFKKLHNRKLLWHGSRVTNFAGILSHGLKIAPPEAPATGYMFGKGIYFADMVSKSANYCFTSQENNTGLLLLSEVALGDMYERLNADYITQLPKDKHSTKGVGMTQPHPKESFLREDGVEIPMGKPYQDKKVKSSLLYNEYIVYDVAQVNIQYLLRMKFNYKYY